MKIWRHFEDPLNSIWKIPFLGTKGNFKSVEVLVAKSSKSFVFSSLTLVSLCSTALAGLWVAQALILGRWLVEFWGHMLSGLPSWCFKGRSCRKCISSKIWLLPYRASSGRFLDLGALDEQFEHPNPNCSISTQFCRTEAWVDALQLICSLLCSMQGSRVV